MDAVDSFTPDLADSLQYYASVDCDGIKYTSNQAVVLNNMNSNPELGKIICFTSVYGEVVLITHDLQTEYYSQMHNAFVVRQDTQQIKILSVNDLITPFPLQMYLASEQTYFIVMRSFIQPTNY